MEVTEGRLAVEANGLVTILTPESGVLEVKPWVNHRLYPPPVTDDPVTKFILSGSDTEESYKLDGVFFQNWYGYQDQVVLGGESLDLLQVMSVRPPLNISPFTFTNIQLDVRRGWFVSFTSLVYTICEVNFNGHVDSIGTMGGRTIGISTISQGMDK